MKAVERDSRTQLGPSRLRDAPGWGQVLLLTVEVSAVTATVLALAASHPTALVWEYLGVLVALSVVFEEGSRRVSRIRQLISAGPRSDVTSVWTLAGALALPAGFAAVLALIVAVYAWLRRQRDVRESLYWRVYTASTVMLACLAAGSFVHVDSSGSRTPFTLEATLVVVMAIIVYTVVNRLLISLALPVHGTPRSRRAVLGQWDNNVVEFATLCLGYMTAQVLVDQPLLAFTSLLPLMLIQRAALVRQLEEAASTDEKTQLLTPLAWRQRVQRQLAAGLADTAALLVLDLDHFKSVNDLHGHLIGDAALFAASTRITVELRPTDLVGRFGGEEFVVLLPGLATGAALAVAERLRRRIGSIRLADLRAEHTDRQPCEHVLSASIGVAIYPQDADDLSTLLVAADAALYAAKRAGRDRVVLADRAGVAAAQEQTTG